jgi:hypothetical protein
MGKRGRASQAALLLAGPKPIEVIERQKAPHDLTDEETEVWAAIVNDKPADWFTPSSAPLLAQLCRHTVQGRRIAELIERATCDTDLVVTDYDRLLHMQERESRTMRALSTALRLTPQSTTNHRGHTKPTTRKPWEG